ncbi:hypothetical protein [Lysobacter humi (ex Lee et al. 2017)]
MANSRTPLFVLLAAATAVGLTVYVVKTRDPQAVATVEPPTAAAATTPVDEPPTRVSLRDGRVATPGSTGVEVTPEQMAARRVEADKQIHAALARMDAEFRQQPTGTGLAAAQGRAQALLSDPLVSQAIAQPASAAFECRAQQCRLTAEFAPGAPPDDWLTRISTAGASLLPNAQVGRVRLPDGRTQVIAYYTGASSAGMRPYKGQR